MPMWIRTTSVKLQNAALTLEEDMHSERSGLFVCLQDYSKNYGAICIKMLLEVGHKPTQKWLNAGVDPNVGSVCRNVGIQLWLTRAAADCSFRNKWPDFGKQSFAIKAWLILSFTSLMWWLTVNTVPLRGFDAIFAFINQIKVFGTPRLDLKVPPPRLPERLLFLSQEQNVFYAKSGLHSTLTPDFCLYISM